MDELGGWSNGLGRVKRIRTDLFYRMTRLFMINRMDELVGWLNGLGRVERIRTDLLLQD